jgi:hypothetical protein
MIASAQAVIVRETRPAAASRVSRSRPNWSVPSGWAKLGGCRDRSRSTSFAP